MLDHAPCPNCAFMWYFDGPVAPGEIAHCDNCARDFRAGRWHGKHYPSLLGSLLRAPQCPGCGGTNSVRGKQVGYSFPDLFMRQCNDCHSIWVARK